MYDSNSNRVQKESINLENIKQNRYLNNDFEIENQKTLDGSGNILTQTKTNKYIFLGNEKIFTIEEIEGSENIVYNISDHLGGGSIDINNTGSILQKSDYYPYGGSRVLERSDNYKNNYLFTGKELDEETDLQYFEVRYYNPDFGRFYGQDKVFWELGNTKRGLQVLQDPQQLNSYSYARNNPIIYVDTSGEEATLAGILGVIFGIEYAGGGPDDNMAQMYKDQSDSMVPAIILTAGAVGAKVAGEKIIKKAGEKVVNSSIKRSSVSKPDLSKIESQKLKSIIERNYREGASIGNGSTADAIRYTKNTGNKVGNSDHIQKGFDTINGLNKILKSGNLNKYETKISNNIINDIKNAIKGK